MDSASLSDLLRGNLFIIGVALWTLPWKGIALWQAARFGDKKWFIVLLVVNTLAILEVVYIFVISKRKALKEKQIDAFRS